MHIIHAKRARIPAIGLGTWQLRGKEARSVTEKALELGYTHIDTAQMYGNEDEIGKAVQASGIDRDDLFLTTKVWWENLDATRFLDSVRESLSKLKVDHTDLLLIHWPHPELPMRAYLESLMEARDAGYTRFVGVSNFTAEMVKEASADFPELVTNQVEYHPYLDQSRVLAACQNYGLVLTAYAPIARGRVLNDKTLGEIGRKYGKSPVQVTLRWHVQQGVVAIPKTSHPDRLKKNLDIFDFSLTEAEMEAIFGLTREKDRLVDPEFAPNW